MAMNRARCAGCCVLVAACQPAPDELDCVRSVATYADRDGDGFGAGPGQLACDTVAGRVANADDCDDDDAAVNPDADEICDPLDRDEDCNGRADDADGDADADGKRPWHRDGDGDGYGVSEGARVRCDAPEGYADRGGDCDDDEALRNPGLPEICADGIDNDCDESAVPCGLAGVEWLSRLPRRFESGLLDVGDVDGDGLIDVLGRVYGGAVVWRGPHGREPGDAKPWLTASDDLRDAWLADVDGDGRDDLVASGDDGTWVKRALSPGALRAEGADLRIADARALGVADLDGDGAAEIVVQAFAVESPVVWLVDGRAIGDAAARDIAVARIDGSDAVSPGDLDGDGFADLGWAVDGDVAIALGPLHGEVTPDVRIAGTGIPGTVRAHRTGDVDGDGRPDLAVSWPDVDGDRLGLFVDPLAAVSLAAPDADLGGLGQAFVGPVGDLDGDGRPSLFVTGTRRDDAEGWVRESYVIGFHAVAVAIESSFGEQPFRAAGADLDRDGVDDLIIGNDRSTWILFGGPGL